MNLYVKAKMKFFQTYQKYKNKNDINSVYISPDSIHGKSIEIASDTYIDQESVISSYTYIGKNCNITKSTIGRYCSIANNVSIGQGEHDITNISTSAYFLIKLSLSTNGTKYFHFPLALTITGLIAL